MYECLSQYIPMRISLFSWFSFILFYWVFLGINISVVSGNCLEDQKLLLLQLKNKLSFNSTNSRKLVLWKESLGCCEWSGVTCDEEGHVNGLDLSDESISGGFDDSSTLFSLQYLQNLNLADNNFSSVIPSEIHKLKNLTSLNLSYAGLVGQIPREISQLTRLVTLDISSLSYLTGKELKLEDPNLQMLVQNLTNIRQLYLDGVSISSTQGKEWCNALLSLTSLEELSMSSCNLSGPIDSSLTRLENLSVISLNNNNLSSMVPETFANFKNLTILSLTSCGLKGIFPQKIFQLGTLKFIDMSDNDLHGSLPDFPLNGSLQTLILSYTRLSGTLPKSISNLSHLSILDLSYCQLNGTLPNSLSNLIKLKYLDLSSNSFSGPIPSLGLLKNLTVLDLSYNNLSGEIASTQFGGLINLVSLDLRNNNLKGMIPSSLFSLPSLQKIRLSFNDFGGEMDEISNLSSSTLDTLDLSNNQLQGPIPTSFFNLKKLNILQLSMNKFNGTTDLDMIRSLQNLTNLDISYNNLSIDTNAMDANLSSFPNLKNLKLASCKLREFPMFVRNQSKLAYLDLSNNQIQGLIPHWVWNLGLLSYLNLSSNHLKGFERSLSNVTHQLFVLDLNSNQLQGKIPVFPSVLYLDYSNNDFNSIIPSENDSNPSFAFFLSLSENNFHGSIPPFLCNFPYLQVLDLSDNNFQGEIPTCLMQIETLGVLNLQNNSLNGSIPDAFPKSCALETLDLHGNQLVGTIPKSLPNCMELEVLNLGDNQIHDRYPCLLKNISSLRVMVLRRNKFHGPIGCPNTNGTWQMLQIVDLAFNNFSGLLPGKCFTTWEAMKIDENQTLWESNLFQFNFFKFNHQVYYQDSVIVTVKGLELKFAKILNLLTSIDFSSNNLEGPIPGELMNLSRLVVLNLSNNAFSNQIPASIGNLKQLESLDLSSNSFSGEIPIQLASLSFLSFLNLSFNHLMCGIPAGPQLQSFEADSFAGNEGLCGSPLTKKCSSDGSSSPKVVHTDSEVEFDWQYVFTGVGFGVGSGMVVAALVFWDRGRKWSNNSIDKILLIILPMMGLAYTPMCKCDDDEAEDDTEEEESDMEENHDHYNAADCYFDYLNFRGEYCVFCTKLDISMKKAIHDPRCTCHHSPSISTSTSSSESDSP